MIQKFLKELLLIWWFMVIRELSEISQDITLQSLFSSRSSESFGLTGNCLNIVNENASLNRTCHLATALPRPCPEAIRGHEEWRLSELSYFGTTKTSSCALPLWRKSFLDSIIYHYTHSTVSSDCNTRTPLVWHSKQPVFKYELILYLVPSKAMRASILNMPLSLISCLKIT